MLLHDHLEDRKIRTGPLVGRLRRVAGGDYTADKPARVRHDQFRREDLG